jgi:outer membrane protein OmpA-like peptidoglycan-associated protein
MRASYCIRSILFFVLLLANSLVHSQGRRQDTLVLHFAFNRYVPLDPLPQSAFGTKKIDSVFITGYTDKTGTTAYNDRLSQQRAEAASSWLQRFARDLPLRLVAGGIAPTSEQSDSANRRAEIILFYPPIADSATSARNAPPAADPTPSDRQRPSDPGVRPTSDTTASPDSTRPIAVISLQHINFVVDTPIPTDATRTRLPGYVSLLQQYKGRWLEIDGYVNSLSPLHGPSDPLFKLSVKRAKFIYDPNRLSYKGMGNATPVNSDPTTREEMDANMRVEIKVY